MAKQEVTIKFGGDTEEVDVNTFTHVLIDYASVIAEAGHKENTDFKINTNIRATQPGCLEAILSVANNGFGGILTDPLKATEFLAATVTVAEGVYRTYKFLSQHGGKIKDEQPATDGSINVTATDGAVINLNNNSYILYKENSHVQKSITDTFATLDASENITSIQISSQSANKFEAKRSDFANIAAVPIYENNDIQHKVIDAVLTVVKPVLSTKHRKWEFVWLGNKISAYIIDSNFLEHLSEYTFSVGTTMNVSLDLTQKYNSRSKVFLNIDYNVVVVNDVCPPSENDPLF
ncbi:hypothetical protein ACUYFE_01350 [Olegusella massiliensis]|uniref:hypothetical protein n=1 Tax=Olegusella massiliensis TaxID=1776381 RepID=UPI0040557E08